MTEPRWTPGPWRVVLIKGSYQRPALVMAGDKTVASCLGDQLDPSATSIGEAAANARLIATAPALYKAMIAVSDMLFGRPDIMRVVHPLLGPNEYSVCTAAAAALRAARGEKEDDR